MAIDHRILTQFSVPDTGAALSKGIANAQRIQQMQQSRDEAPFRNQLLEQSVTTGQQGIDKAAETARLTSIVTGLAELSPTIETGDKGAVARQLGERRARLISEGKPTNDTDEAFAMLAQPNGMELLQQSANEGMELGFQTGILKRPAGGGGLASAKTEILPDGAVVQALPDGSVQVRNNQGNIVAGEERSRVLKQSRQVGLDIKQAESDIAVEETREKAGATNRAKRVSDVTKEMNDRNRAAKRGEINLSQAATLVEQASQGIEGVNKVRLARLFPGIDVSNEAALSQSLTNLALDELQKFKGPTTDFEFQKTEQIAGTLGDSKTANRAKIASLQRANWFNQRESKQFQQHVKNGGDPDSFGFNFGEPVKTKKGVFTLKDLQDTAVANNISIDEALKRLNK